MNDEFEEGNFKWLYIVRVIISIISIISCLLMIIAFIINKNIRQQFTNVLSVQLCISCIIQGICCFIHYSEEDLTPRKNILCQTQGAVLCSSFICSFFFTTVILLAIYSNFCEKRVFENNLLLKILSSLFVWIISISIAVLYWLFGWDDVNKIKPGKTNLCWIKSFSMTILNLCLVILLFVFNSLLLIFLFKKINKYFMNYNDSDSVKDYRDQFRQNLCKYILAQFIVFGGLVVTTVFELIIKKPEKNGSNVPTAIFFFIRDLLECSVGFLFCITYCYNVEVKKVLISIFRRQSGSEEDGISSIHQEIQERRDSSLDEY